MLLVTWLLMIHSISVQILFPNRLTKNEQDSKYALFEKVPFPKVGIIPVLNRKVFKGVRVTIREHPYIVSIRRKLSHYTMGVLLTQNLVISAAHHLLGVPVQELKIVAGENYSDRGMSAHTVLLVIIHEEFDPYTLQADIALLRCHEYVYFRSAVKHIKVVKPGTDVRGYNAHVTGWGRCDLTRDVKVGPGMICAGPARSEDPLAPCMAVPGAPLVIHGDLVGLQSWGFGCGYKQDLPLVYTSMEYYAEWIAGNVKLLSGITQNELSQFYQATRASELIEWLKLTRYSNVSDHIKQFDIITVDVDMLLARVNGTIYDIRDFMYGGIFNPSKHTLFKHLREKYEKKLLDMSRIPLQFKLVPFLDRNSTGFNNIAIQVEEGENE